MCSKKFATKSSVEYHKKVIHKIENHSRPKKKVKVESKERYCQLCNILYKKPCFFNIHKRRVHSTELDAFEKEISINDLKHQCNACKKSFYSENTLNYHFQSKHFKGNAKICQLCDYEFTNTQKFYNHKYKVHKFEYELFKKELIKENFAQICLECPKKFPTKSSLEFHKSVFHRKLPAANKVKKENGEKGCKGNLKQEDSKKNMTVENFMNFFNSLTS